MSHVHYAGGSQGTPSPDPDPEPRQDPWRDEIIASGFIEHVPLLKVILPSARDITPRYRRRRLPPDELY